MRLKLRCSYDFIDLFPKFIGFIDASDIYRSSLEISAESYVMLGNRLGIRQNDYRCFQALGFVQIQQFDPTAAFFRGHFILVAAISQLLIDENQQFLRIAQLSSCFFRTDQFQAVVQRIHAVAFCHIQPAPGLEPLDHPTEQHRRPVRLGFRSHCIQQFKCLGRGRSLSIHCILIHFPLCQREGRIQETFILEESISRI